MSEETQSKFSQCLLLAPAGVALLAGLEVAQRDDTPWFGWPKDSNPDAVQRAVAQISTMSIGTLLELAVASAERLAGPWSGDSLSALPYLYGQAEDRHEIAEAIAETFHTELFQEADPVGQEWWYEEPRDESSLPYARFGDYSRVYGNGEFTWSGLWTATRPPAEVHDALISAWDHFGRPTSRWLLPVRPEARVWSIDTPEDWVRLVERYPRVAASPHSGWELPGPNQHPSDTTMLRRIARQHAVRTEISEHVLPDWELVAGDYDGIHLSWAGFLTAEGYVSDLPRGGVTMMRYWASERTLWLHDVFGEPEPLAAPVLTGRVGDGVGIDARHNAERRNSDRSALEKVLGR